MRDASLSVNFLIVVTNFKKLHNYENQTIKVYIMLDCFFHFVAYAEPYFL